MTLLAMTLVAYHSGFLNDAVFSARVHSAGGKTFWANCDEGLFGIASGPFIHEVHLPANVHADQFREMPASIERLRLSGREVDLQSWLDKASPHRLELLDVSRGYVPWLTKVESSTPWAMLLRSDKFRETHLIDVGDVDFEWLANRFTKLKEVSLRGSNVNPDRLSEVLALPNLRSLNLEKTPVDDSICEQLEETKHLTHINVADTAITVIGLSRCDKLLRRLQKISIAGLQSISDENLGLIFGKSENLEWIDLSRTNVTANGLEFIIANTNATYVNIRNTAVKNFELARIENLQLKQNIELSMSTDSLSPKERKQLGAKEFGVLQGRSGDAVIQVVVH